MQAHPQEPPEVYSNLLPSSIGETTGGIHPMPSGIKIYAPPEVNISAPPEVNVPYSWAGIACTSAGATGGILKSTPAVEAIAPQVNVSTAGKHRPARTEDRR